jgi:hypothetical protein
MIQRAADGPAIMSTAAAGTMLRPAHLHRAGKPRLA